ncbi:MAG TPA: purine-nucleoside phosphorylase, partial [Rhodothermales bacterium]
MPARPDTDDQDRLDEAAHFLRDRGVATPSVALILGSGMGIVAEALEDAIRISFNEIPHFPAATVEGHAGALLFGRLERHPCVLFQGRIHPYEGRSAREVTFAVRLARHLGADLLLATNAAGGIAPDLEPGSLMLIAGHVSLTPLETYGIPGRRNEGPYEEPLLREVEDAALGEGVRLRRGVYGWTMGPSYETQSEIQALRRIGADAVGMSTIPEILQA